jgi:hypothetical protein
VDILWRIFAEWFWWIVLFAVMGAVGIQERRGGWPWYRWTP